MANSTERLYQRLAEEKQLFNRLAMEARADEKDEWEKDRPDKACEAVGRFMAYRIALKEIESLIADSFYISKEGLSV